MEKAIDIKRRAQRCIQNGDLDGALTEYEKLVSGEEADPYNFVLLADLLYKKGDQSGAAERFLSAVAAYQKASLYKNAIAVCKKMLRLSLSPAKVLSSLAQLHLLDGLAGEAALYYVQYAEHMVRSSAPAEAAEALRKAFDACQDNLKVLEQLSEAWLLAGENDKSAQVMLEAAAHYRSRGAESEAVRCELRANHLDPTAAAPELIVAAAHAPMVAASTASPVDDFLPPIEEPRSSALEATPIEWGAIAPQADSRFSEPLETESTSRMMLRPDFSANSAVAPEGFDSGRHGFEFSSAQPEEAAPAALPEDFAVTEHDVSATYGLIPVTASADAAPDAAPDTAPVHEIEDQPVTAEVLESIGTEAASEADADADVVYEINADEDEPIGAYEREIKNETVDDEPAGVYEITDESSEPDVQQSPALPGLAFASAAEPERIPDAAHANPLEHVEALLAMAQEQFRAGERDEASSTLSEAARAYELLGRFDSAATIYRSLGRGAQATPHLIEQWLGNCERRADTQEAAQVACELGDRALNDGDENSARSWFERALAFDAANETARRRLQRLTGAGSPADGGQVAVATATSTPSAGPASEVGRVEVAVGRAEAVSFDLAGLLSEFQKGVAAQLAGDAQSHYDLGMTYREMGLLEQAIDSFHIAQEDPQLAPRALEMSGRCLADEGRHHEACGDFRRAIGLLDSAAGTDGEVRFYLAHSLTEIGDHEAALAEYKLVEESLPGYEDVLERIAALRRVLGRA